MESGPWVQKGNLRGYLDSEDELELEVMEIERREKVRRARKPKEWKEIALYLSRQITPFLDDGLLIGNGPDAIAFDLESMILDDLCAVEFDGHRSELKLAFEKMAAECDRLLEKLDKAEEALSSKDDFETDRLQIAL